MSIEYVRTRKPRHRHTTFKTWRLPQLDIGEEAPPLGLSIVLVEMLDLLDAQVSSAGETVCGGRISPGSSEDNLVSGSETKDDENTNHILEEVGGRKASATL